MAELTAFDQANISRAPDQSLCIFVRVAVRKLAEVMRSFGNRAQASLYLENAWPLFSKNSAAKLVLLARFKCWAIWLIYESNVEAVRRQFSQLASSAWSGGKALNIDEVIANVVEGP